MNGELLMVSEELRKLRSIRKKLLALVIEYPGCNQSFLVSHSFEQQSVVTNVMKELIRRTYVEAEKSGREVRYRVTDPLILNYYAIISRDKARLGDPLDRSAATINDAHKPDRNQRTL
jgi:hypothetical protein